ncbi:MAG: hypothetical protein LBP22_00005 [Deltaproteobacteria bacterium]|nr:hypothetical protein [Deltaproteobacteria bacterium]
MLQFTEPFIGPILQDLAKKDEVIAKITNENTKITEDNAKLREKIRKLEAQQNTYISPKRQFYSAK